MERPSIYAYLDYRHFLRDMVEYSRERGTYSTRTFGKKVGFKSSSHMKMIIDGSRNLTDEMADRVAEAFGLKTLEVQFFQTLVHFNQAESFTERDKIFKEMQTFKKFNSLKKADRAQYDCFSTWYMIAILEGLGTNWNRKSVKEMAESLKITEAEVERAISTLSEVGLIEKRRGNWVPVNAAISTPEELNSLNVRNYHKQMIEKAVEASDKIGNNDQSLASLTIALSPQNFAKLKNKMFKILRTMNAEFSDDPSPEKIYQVNLQIFSLMGIK